MAVLTTLNITEKNDNNSLSVTVKVNITQKGVLTTTLSKEDVDKIRSYGIKLPTTCECGCINKGLSLRDRTWVCPACGAVNDRDVLAARNILRKGISELESKSNSNDSNIGVSCVCIQESHLL